MAAVITAALTVLLALFCVKTVIFAKPSYLLRAFLDSWMPVISCALLTAAFAYFCDWAVYAVIKAAVRKKGTSAGGTIVPVKKLPYSTITGKRYDYRCVIETADGEKVKSGVYKTLIPLEPPVSCTVHRLGRFVVLTDIAEKQVQEQVQEQTVQEISGEQAPD